MDRFQLKNSQVTSKSSQFSWKISQTKDYLSNFYATRSEILCFQKLAHKISHFSLPEGIGKLVDKLFRRAIIHSQHLLESTSNALIYHRSLMNVPKPTIELNKQFLITSTNNLVCSFKSGNITRLLLDRFLLQSKLVSILQISAKRHTTGITFKDLFSSFNNCSLKLQYKSRSTLLLDILDHHWALYRNLLLKHSYFKLDTVWDQEKSCFLQSCSPLFLQKKETTGLAQCIKTKQRTTKESRQRQIELIWPKAVIWTDGSLDEEGQRMGCGVLIHYYDHESVLKKTKNYSLRIPYVHPSSTTAELQAIHLALEHLEQTTHLELFTDSQCSIQIRQYLAVKLYFPKHQSTSGNQMPIFQNNQS